VSVKSRADQYIKDYIQEPCWVLGHSVGGAIAILLAGLNPDLIRGIISVEGNFTLNDAFWCQKIARLSLSEWSAQYLEIQHDPEAWLAHSGIPASPTYINWANNILHHQSADTIWFMAQSVVCDTHHPSYLETVSCLLQRGIPIHLMAGERSVEDWDVPEWVRQQAQSSTVFSGAGHMIMLEQPSFFCHKVQSIMQCSYSTL
jgi:pimeloyl-ACP methyl ester carboxylesterase